MKIEIAAAMAFFRKAVVTDSALGLEQRLHGLSLLVDGAIEVRRLGLGLK